LLHHFTSLPVPHPKKKGAIPVKILEGTLIEITAAKKADQ
jgi:hypothetical protein